MIVSIFLEQKDLRLLSRIVRRFEKETIFPENGYFKRCSDEEIWKMIIEQIAVIGKAEPAERIEKKKVSLRALGILKHDRRKLLSLVNKVLARAGVRYVSKRKISKKARWIVDNFLNSEIVQEGKVVLLERMDAFLSKHRFKSSRERELAAREFIVNNVKGFGLKSASDFLIELGYAKTLIPFDIRELEFINKVLKPNISINNLSPGIYLLLEESFQVLQEKIGVPPSRFDRIVFQHKDEIIKVFSNL